MRSDDVIEMDGGPRVAKMYRLAVEYFSATEGVPMSRIYQDALDLFLAEKAWTEQELKDYYGRRAYDLNQAMAAMSERGISSQRTNKRERDKRVRKVARAA